MQFFPPKKGTLIIYTSCKLKYGWLVGGAKPGLVGCLGCLVVWDITSKEFQLTPWPPCAGAMSFGHCES